MEVFQILVVVAMIGIAVWQKRREKQAKRVREYKQQLKERVEQHLLVAPSPAPSDSKPQKKKKKVESHYVPSPTLSVPVAPVGSCKKKRSSVELHTPEEARRAFIYSEIFNRKYE